MGIEADRPSRGLRPEIPGVAILAPYGMTDEEAFHAFLSGLQPHLQEHVGAHEQGDLEAAIAMAQHLEVYHDGDGAKMSSKGPKKFKNQKKGNVA